MINFFKQLFIPHHTNNFKAKLLHADFLAVYVLIFFIFSLSVRTISKINPNILGFATDIQTDKLLILTNQKRAESGLNPLALDNRLSTAAMQKAADMFANNYWAHNSPQGKTPWDFINGSGYVYTVAGENLAKNFADSDGVVQAWMNSATHKENILRSEYSDVGFAVVNGTLNGEETTLVVQMFGNKLSAPEIAQAPVAKTTEIIPPTQAKADEVSLGTQYLSEENIYNKISTIGSVPTPPKPVEILPIAGSVVKSPIFDIGKISKTLTLAIASILMIILAVDAVFVWKKKVVRVGGKNLAHLLFLFLITGFIWFMSFGSII